MIPGDVTLVGYSSDAGRMEISDWSRLRRYGAFHHQDTPLRENPNSNEAMGAKEQATHFICSAVKPLELELGF
jgi:hypothetical protein